MPTAKNKKIYKHVLFATDLSKQSNVVAKRAADIASNVGAKLSIVHVLSYSPVAYAGEFSIPIDAEFEHTLEKNAKKQLATQAKKYSLPIKSQYLMEGSVKLGVTDLAKKIKADLIVVGTHGHEGLNLLLGSQANAILHAAPCDVWVVRIK